MKAVEVDTYVIGYPCYKPIIRSIDSDGDIPEFERFVFGIARMDRLSDSDAVKLLDELKQHCLTDKCVLFNADLYKMNESDIKKDDVPSYIMSRNKIRTHKQCTAYYQEFQTSKNACLACKRSPYYSNKYLLEELSVLKYMLANKDNCSYIEQKVEELHLEFLGVFDILYNFMDCKKTLYIPLNRLIYNYVFQNDETLFFGSMFDHPEDRIELLNDCFTDDYTGFSKELPSEIALRFRDLQRNIIIQQIKRIEESSDLTKADIDIVLEKMSAFQKERTEKINSFSGLSAAQKTTFISYVSKPEKKSTPKKTVEEKHEQTYLDIIEIYSAAKEEEEKQREEAVNDKPVVTNNENPVVIEEDSQDKEPEIVVSKEVSIEENTLTEPSDEPVETIQTDDVEENSVVETVTESVSEEENGADESPVTLIENFTQEEKRGVEEQVFEDSKDPTASYSLCLYNTKAHLLSCDYPKFHYKTDTVPQYREIIAPKKESSCMEFYLSNEQLKGFRPIKGNLITLAEMEDASLKDRCIAVEAVCTPFGLALVLFTASRHLFAVTSMKNDVEKRVIGKMLRRNGLKKVCYQPYLLYAFCYENGLKIDGVHSLLTQHYFLHPETESPALSDLIMKYVTSNKQYAREKLEKSDNILYDAMRYYKKAFMRQEKEKKEQNLANLIRMEEFDRALGYSYLLGGSLKTTERLFARKGNVRFDFHNNAYLDLKKQVRFSGYFATYEFPVWTKHAAGIITQFLCNLSKDNVFGEYNIQIMAVYKNRVTFFIAKDEFDYLDSVIGTTLRLVASQYGHPLLPLSVVYEYHKEAVNGKSV